MWTQSEVGYLKNNYSRVPSNQLYSSLVGRSSNSLRVNDLPKAMIVLNEAYKYLLLKEGYEKSSASNEENQPIESEMDEVI